MRVRACCLIYTELTDLPRASWSVLHLHLVHVLELSRLGKLLESPHRLRHLIGLGFASSTTMRMVEGVHRYTSDLGAETSVTASACFSPLRGLVLSVGHRAQGRVALLVHVAMLARAQSDDDTVLVRVFRKQSSKCARSSHELATAANAQAYIVDDGSRGNHLQGHAVAPLHETRVQEGFVDLAIVGFLHLVHEILWNTATERLHRVARAQPGRSQNVRQIPRLVMLQQCNVGRPIWIVLDAHHGLFSGRKPVRVHQTHTALVATTTAADCDFSGVVTPSGLLFGHGQLLHGATFVEVLVDGFPVMRGAGLEMALWKGADFDLCRHKFSLSPVDLVFLLQVGEIIEVVERRSRARRGHRGSALETQKRLSCRNP